MRNFLALLAFPMLAATAVAEDKPNVLWITSEDNGPHIGCYGDSYATTPNIDALAKKGMLYRNCWSTAPVCAPARTTLISGLYPPSTGGQHMRSLAKLPAAFKMYPQYLREAGYYCTNRSKEDYNLAKPGQVWDDGKGKKGGHWKGRKEGQPFFAIFNHTISHESQMRKRPHKPVHDPKKVRIPGYHPDTPEVRQDWAQYYDKVTEMDALAGANLKEIEEAKLADDTIIFYYGDHGSGMPRNKRWTYNSGLHVPLIVYIPEKFKHLRPKDYKAGGESNRLVGFIDFAPTLLSLVGIEPPKHMQGHAFLGKHVAEAPKHIHGFRDRMDERYDMCRSVRDERFIYIRNYKPHKPWGQHIGYMFQTPATRIWKKMFDEGKLNAAQSRFWQTKPAEELYDLKNDPDEIVNLAGQPQHVETLKKLRTAQQEHAKRIRDVGFLPEGEIHTRSEGSTPYEMGHDDKKFPFEKIMAAAEKASSLKAEDFPAVLAALKDGDSAVRYWGALGILMRGQTAVDLAKDELHKALADGSPHVRIVAAEALGHYGSADDAAKAVDVLIKEVDPSKTSAFISMQAMNVVDQLDEKAAKAKDIISKMPTKDPKAPGRPNGYVARLVEKTLADLK